MGATLSPVNKFEWNDWSECREYVTIDCLALNAKPLSHPLRPRAQHRKAGRKVHRTWGGETYKTPSSGYDVVGGVMKHSGRGS